MTLGSCIQGSERTDPIDTGDCLYEKMERIYDAGGAVYQHGRMWEKGFWFGASDGGAGDRDAGGRGCEAGRRGDARGHQAPCIQWR